MGISDAIQVIDGAKSFDELKKLQGAIKDRWDVLTRRSAREFAPGDEVEFEDKAGVTVEGTVKKVNRKSVNVIVAGRKWRVSPTYLRHK